MAVFFGDLDSGSCTCVSHLILCTLFPKRRIMIISTILGSLVIIFHVCEWALKTEHHTTAVETYHNLTNLIQMVGFTSC